MMRATACPQEAGLVETVAADNEAVDAGPG
jgi:hypothetical protein